MAVKPIESKSFFEIIFVLLFSSFSPRVLSCCLSLTLVGATVTPAAIAQTNINSISHEVLPEKVDELLGETVTIRSRVIRILADGNFWIQGEPLLTGKNILIINATGGPLPERRYEYTKLQVTGEVRRLEIATLEAERNEVYDLDRDLYVGYETFPVVIATSIAIAPSAGDITQYPDWYYDRFVVIEGQVAEIFGRNFFTIAEEQLYGGTDLLVAGDREDFSRLQEQQRIVVTGRIRPFIALELAQEDNLNSDLALMGQLEADYIAQPILIVDEIYLEN